MNFLRLLPILFALLCGDCKEPAEVTFISHQFSVEVPEFLQVTPEQSFELFRSIEPKLETDRVLELAAQDAPHGIAATIDDWRRQPDGRYIRANQFGQNLVNVTIYGKGTGLEDVDDAFQQHLEAVLRRRIADLVSEIGTTAEQGVAPQSATRSESDSEGDDKPQPESEPRSR